MTLKKLTMILDTIGVIAFTKDGDARQVALTEEETNLVLQLLKQIFYDKPIQVLSENLEGIEMTNQDPTK